MNDHEDIFLSHINRYYPITNLRKKIKCLFHNENTASLGFFKKNNQWHYKCFGCGKSGNIYSFLMSLYNIEFKEAAALVNKENSFIPKRKYFIPEFSIKPKEDIDIVPTPVSFNKFAYEFFDYWHIKKTIAESLGWIQCDRYSIIKYADKNITDIKVYKPDTLCFAIITNDISLNHKRCKIYTPDSNPKIFGNTNINTLIMPNIALPENPIFCYTGGMKDCAVFNSLELPIIGVSTNSENVIGNPSDLPGIKVCLMDNDKAGIAAEAKYLNCGIESLSILYKYLDYKDLALCALNDINLTKQIIYNEYKRIIN